MDSKCCEYDQEPGVCLRWEKVRGGFLSAGWAFELRTADQQAIASVLGWPNVGSMTASTGGKTFTWNRRWNDRPARPAPPVLAELVKGWGQDPRKIRELIDDTGTPILYVSGESYNGQIDVRITFPDRRWFQFRIRATERRDAFMTATDQAGKKVARFRVSRVTRFNQHLAEVEIVVHPDRTLTDELVLAVAISPPWLHHYFLQPGGGG
jgi:hypothetical protein